MPSSCSLGLNGSRLPDHEALFGQTHCPIEKQRERREQQDAGDHRIHIEETLRLMDEVADAFCRAQIFADDCSYERKSYRVVQAGENPAHRARHINMAQELAWARTEHARVGEHDRADLAHALIDVEKHDEEDERHTQRHFRADTEPEPDEEYRCENHPRHRVNGLDVWIEDRGGRRRQREPQADHDAGHRAYEKCEQRFDQRHPEMLVDLSGNKPLPQAREYLYRLAEEERRLVGFGKV